MKQGARLIRGKALPPLDILGARVDPDRIYDAPPDVVAFLLSRPDFEPVSLDVEETKTAHEPAPELDDTTPGPTRKAKRTSKAEGSKTET